MPSLAGNITNQLPYEDSEPLVYPKPPECFLSIIGNVTDELAYFIFHAKAKGTYEGYTSYVNNYISFCKTRGVAAFPTTPICLAEWAAIRARPSMLGKAMKADSIFSALSAIRWAHIVRRPSLDAFNDPFVKLAVEGIRRVQGNYEKKKALPLSKMQLAKITSPIKQGCILSAKDMDNLNIDAAFKCAFAGFLRTAEITYEKKELKNPTLFERNHLLRRDVHFSENYDHAILSLRASKADTEFKGIEILLSSDPHSPTCAVTALRNLFERDPQPLNAPLFRISSGAFLETIIYPHFAAASKPTNTPMSLTMQDIAFAVGLLNTLRTTGCLTRIYNAWDVGLRTHSRATLPTVMIRSFSYTGDS